MAYFGLTYDQALKIAVECLRAHSIGPTGIFSEAASLLETWYKDQDEEE